MRLVFDRWIDAGRPARFSMRAFLSLVPYQGGYVGLVRDFEASPNARMDECKTALQCVRMDADFRMLEDSHTVLIAEDPRVFLADGEPMAIGINPVYREGDFQVFLTSVQLPPYARRLLLEPAAFHGKNWVPCVDGRSLYVIRSLEPLFVAHVGIDGLCRAITPPAPVELHQTQSCSLYRHFGERRGGAVATFADGKMIGFGHRTRRSELHTVFRYTIDVSTWGVQFEDVEAPAEIAHYALIDPTAQWEDKLLVCCTRRDWKMAMPSRHALLRIA